MTRPIARQGLTARKTSPKTMLRITKPSQTVTKTNVTEKLRSGASVPFSPAHTVRPNRKTPIAPHRTSTGRLSSAREKPGAIARQRSSSKRLVCQRTVSAKNEMIRTNAAAHANSHSGIGRSWRPTSAWPTTWSGAVSDIRRAQAGLTVISAIGTTLCSSSASNTPVSVAGTSNSTEPPASTSWLTS